MLFLIFRKMHFLIFNIPNFYFYDHHDQHESYHIPALIWYIYLFLFSRDISKCFQTCSCSKPITILATFGSGFVDFQRIRRRWCSQDGVCRAEYAVGLERVRKKMPRGAVTTTDASRGMLAWGTRIDSPELIRKWVHASTKIFDINLIRDTRLWCGAVWRGVVQQGEVRYSALWHDARSEISLRLFLARTEFAWRQETTL